MGIKVLQTSHGPCCDCRVLRFIRSTPVEKFVLFSTKLALRKNILVHENAQILTYRHLGFQKFHRGDTLGPPLEGDGRRGEGEGKAERGRGCKGKKLRREGRDLCTHNSKQKSAPMDASARYCCCVDVSKVGVT